MNLREVAERSQLPDQYGSRDEEAAQLGRAVFAFLDAGNREDIATFAAAMNRKMAKNGHRGESWRDRTPSEILTDLRRHVDKLETRMGQSYEQTLSDAADIGNLAMMLAERSQ